MGPAGVDAAILQRDSDVRYLTGMPTDSLLFLFRTGKSVLVPWDEILAGKRAEVDEIIPYTEFGRKLNTAAPAVLGRENLQGSPIVEIGGSTSHPVFESLQAALPNCVIHCSAGGIEEALSQQRQIKDEGEIAVLRKAAQITDYILRELEELTQKGELTSEVDVAMYLERVTREMGAEGTGFDPIVAGPDRSFGIHAFPGYTSSPYATGGLSIVDFGVRLDGYTSDVTVTVVGGEPTELQNRMIDLVQEAYDLAVGSARVGATTSSIAEAVDELFGKQGFHMPHSLGHGIGLDVHEAPSLRSSGDDGICLENGMVFTIEPGLYHPDAGGVRLENDVLLHHDRAEIITSARILRLPSHY